MEIQPLYCFRAKCVGNWKSEILWWAHYLVRNKKIVKFGVYRLCSLDVRRAYASHASPPPGPPPPARPVPPRNTWLRHATETRRAHQWEIDRLVDGVREYESPAHAPRFLYRLGTQGTVWGLGLTNQQKTEHFLPCFWHRLFFETAAYHLLLMNRAKHTRQEILTWPKFGDAYSEFIRLPLRVWAVLTPVFYYLNAPLQKIKKYSNNCVMKIEDN